MAGFFAALWNRPALVGDQALHIGSTILVVELVLIHAAGLMGAVATSGLTTPQRIGALAGSLLVYLPFAELFVIFMDAWWSVDALAWLTLGKLALSMRSDPLSADARAEMKSFWGASVGLFVLGWLIFAVIPVPELGVRSATLETAKLALGGPFVEEPQRITAIGLFYFGLLGWAKFAGSRLEGPARPEASAGELISRVRLSQERCSDGHSERLAGVSRVAVVTGRPLPPPPGRARRRLLLPLRRRSR